jgi:glycerophosphoryl diester phosphodiesterase
MSLVNAVKSQALTPSAGAIRVLTSATSTASPSSYQIAQKTASDSTRNAQAINQPQTSLASAGGKQRSGQMSPKAVDLTYKQTVLLNGGRQVTLRARNDGTLFIDIPDRFSIPDRFGLPSKAASLNLQGVSKSSSSQQITTAVEKLCSNVDVVPWVYDGGKTPKYNDGGAGAATEVRRGLGWVLAHGGDREAKPESWREAEWENSIQAIRSTRAKGAIPELDVQWNKNGELFLHHDGAGRKIYADGKPREIWNDEFRPKKDANGKPVVDAAGNPEGVWVRGKPRARVPPKESTSVNIHTANLKEVDQVAERLGNVLKTFPPTKSGRPSFILEMKKGIASPEVMAQALYNQLKKSNRLTDVVISSMHSEMLTAMHDLAIKDRVPLKLMKVLGLPEKLDNAYVDKLIKSTPWIRYIGFPTDYGGHFVSKNDVDYAKRQGLFTVGWNWDPSNELNACGSSTERANELDLDAQITDCITGLNQSDPGHWKLGKPQ